MTSDSPPRIGSDRAFLLAAAFEGGLAVLAVVLGWLTDIAVVGSVGAAWRDVLLALVTTAVLAPLPFVTARATSGPLAGIRAIVEKTLLPVFGGCSFGQIVLLAALAGVGEELLFRGWLQPWLEGGLQSLLGVSADAARWIALGAASLLFGAAHALTRAYFVLATVMGLLMGGLWLYTGSLLAPILVHALYDLIALRVLLSRRPPG